MGIAAACVGGLTLAAIIVTFIWVAILMTDGAGGFAIMSVMPIMGPTVLILGIVGVILSLAVIAQKNFRRLGIAGLLLSATPILAWLILLVVALAMG